MSDRGLTWTALTLGLGIFWGLVIFALGRLTGAW